MTSWDEYLKKQGFTKSVGIVHDGKGLLVRAEPGNVDYSVPHLDGVIATLTDRYHMPEGASPAEGHGAGFLDPSVLDEFAADKNLKLDPATNADRETVRWVSKDGVNTFYTARIKPWLDQRATGVDPFGPIVTPPTKPVLPDGGIVTPVIDPTLPVLPADFATLHAQLLAEVEVWLTRRLQDEISVLWDKLVAFLGGAGKAATLGDRLELLTNLIEQVRKG